MPDESEEGGVTESTQARWKYLSSALALIYIPAYLILGMLVATGHAHWPGGNGGGALMTGFFAFVAYVVGTEVYEMVYS